MASVLLVEDTGLQASLLRRFLSASHTIAGEAQTAAEAVELARETEPDVVVMDLNLQSGDGIAATEEIRTFAPDVSIIASTVFVTDDARSRAMDAGADEYLTKPYSREELLETIERVHGGRSN